MIDRSRRVSTVVAGILMAAALLGPGCASEAYEGPTGSLSMELQIAPGVTINSVAFTISNTGSGFTKSGTVNVRFSNTISFQTGAIPAGSGYSITLTATSVDNSFSCSGSASFSVSAGGTTPVSLTLSCSTAPAGQGTIVVNGTTQICANLDSLSASPLETAVGTPIALAATGSAGTVPVTFSWTAPAGTFDNGASATPTFTCPTTPGPVTITVTALPSAAACPNVFSQSVTVTCDALTPTFTNVYTSIIGVRCTGCHRPGGGGVTVGMLDMSTPAAAFANLIGVNAQGTAAGSSGITCASLMPAQLRVSPGASADSILFNKVSAKRNGTAPRCGSGMPLPATATSLTQAEVDLIGAWIDAGALSN